MPKSSSSSHLKQCLGSGLYELSESSFSQSSNTCKLSPENSSVDFSQDPYLVGCWSWLKDEKKKGRILPVRDQGDTNACYAFVIATTIGGAQGLEGCRCSEQELLDRLHIYFPPCYKIPDHKGLPNKIPDHKGLPNKIPDHKGLPNNFVNGFGYAKKHGIYFEKDYQWVGQCQPEQPKNLPSNLEKIYVKDFKCVDDGNHKLIVEQLEKQPLAGFIKPTSTFLSWGFEDIIYEGPSKEESEAMELYHAVTLVGYGGSVEGSNDYYLCQNSYGVKWGHHGYFKVRRNAVTHVCYPVGVYKAKTNINGVVQTTHQPSTEIVDMEVDTITPSSDDMEFDTMLSSSDDMEIDEVAMDID